MVDFCVVVVVALKRSRWGREGRLEGVWNVLAFGLSADWKVKRGVNDLMIEYCFAVRFRVVD